MIERLVVWRTGSRRRGTRFEKVYGRWKRDHTKESPLDKMRRELIGILVHETVVGELTAFEVRMRVGCWKICRRREGRMDVVHAGT